MAGSNLFDKVAQSIKVSWFHYKVLLGYSWNYMLPIIVPSSAKRMATRTLVPGTLYGI